MFKKRFHELDALHLNVGVPILITMIMVIINFQIFALKFLENPSLFYKFHLYIALIILILRLLITKRQKEKKKKLKLSMYEFGVLNSMVIFLFFILNFALSDTVYKNSFLVDRKLVHEIKTLEIEPKFHKAFEVNIHEYKAYYNSGFFLEVEIKKSIFGFHFISKRDFKL